MPLKARFRFFTNNDYERNFLFCSFVLLNYLTMASSTLSFILNINYRLSNEKKNWFIIDLV